MHGLGRSPSDWLAVSNGLGAFGQVQAPALPRNPAQALRRAEAAITPGAILIGHSLGGVLALQLASKTTAPLRALVLTGCFFPPARNERSIGTSLRDYAGHRVAYVRALDRRRGGSPGSAGGGPPGSAGEGSNRAESAGALISLIGLALRRRELYEELATVRPPLLVVHARDDHHVPLDFALAAVATRPATGLRVLDVGGHHSHVVCPARWLEVVTPWLSQEVARPRP